MIPHTTYLYILLIKNTYGPNILRPFIYTKLMNLILLHGTWWTPDNHWFPDIQEFCFDNDVSCRAPEIPNSDNIHREEASTYIIKNGTFTSDTIIIWHSAGAALILSILEHLDSPIKQAILVAWFLSLDYPCVKSTYDRDSIKKNAWELICINSNDDPRKCDHTQGELICERTWGTLIVPRNQWHFWTETFNQEYTTFPLLKRLIDA